MQIIGCQLDIAWEDKSTNFERVRALLDAAAPGRDALIVLPEMFATGFSMNVAGITEDDGGETESFLSRTARDRGALVLGGLVRRDPLGKGLNQAVACAADGRELARYTKLHPFSYGGEDQHYLRGREVVLFPWGSFTVAPFICYDLRFPEVFRTATRRGATLLVVMACWPSVRAAHWLPLLRARAIENQCYAVGVNRCGADPHLTYFGQSVVIDPQGEVIASAGEEPGIVTADIAIAPLLDYRRRFPALADIHPGFAPAP